MHFLGKISWS